MYHVSCLQVPGTRCQYSIVMMRPPECLMLDDVMRLVAPMRHASRCTNAPHRERLIYSSMTKVRAVAQAWFLEHLKVCATTVLPCTWYHEFADTALVVCTFTSIDREYRYKVGHTWASSSMLAPSPIQTDPFFGHGHWDLSIRKLHSAISRLAASMPYLLRFAFFLHALNRAASDSNP